MSEANNKYLKRVVVPARTDWALGGVEGVHSADVEHVASMAVRDILHRAPSPLPSGALAESVIACRSELAVLFRELDAALGIEQPWIPLPLDTLRQLALLAASAQGDGVYLKSLCSTLLAMHAKGSCFLHCEEGDGDGKS